MDNNIKDGTAVQEPPVENKSYFDPEEVEVFDGEFSSDKQEGVEDGIEDVEFDDFEGGLATTEEVQEDREFFKLLWLGADDTRAVLLAMFAGDDKEQYKVYPKGKVPEYILQAGAKVVRKHNIKMSPEWILLVAFSMSTLLMFNKANQNKKMKNVEVVEKKKKAQAKSDKSEQINPI